MEYKNGFSLVEVIIAITIIGVIGVISTTILTRTYRVNTQSDNVSKLKQNGDAAVNAITEALRNAEGVVCYSTTAPRKSMVIRTLAGKYIKFRFQDPTPVASSPVTANGYVVKQENLNVSDYDSFCTTTLSTPTELAITNKEVLGGVSISNGEFTSLTGRGGKDLVTIKFTVNPSLTYGGIGSNKFDVQTTVQIR